MRLWLFNPYICHIKSISQIRRNNNIYIYFKELSFLLCTKLKFRHVLAIVYQDRPSVAKNLCCCVIRKKGLTKKAIKHLLNSNTYEAHSILCTTFSLSKIKKAEECLFNKKKRNTEMNVKREDQTSFRIPGLENLLQTQK